MRHELCHGVDEQFGVARGASARIVADLDRVVLEVESDPDHPLAEALDGLAPEDARSEVLAYTCQHGPLGTALLASPCPGESHGHAEIARWIHESIWAGEPDVSLSGDVAVYAEPASWPAGSGVETLGIFGSELRNAALILAVTEDRLREFPALSTGDGAEVAPVEDPTVGAIEAGYAEPPPVEAPPDEGFSQAIVRDVLAVSNGATTLRIVEGLHAPNLDMIIAPHVIATTGDAWTVVDGACPTGPSSVFLANDRLYLGWAEDDVVVWAPVD